MVLFLIVINYMSALMAVQLLRGDFGNSVYANFGEVYNSFLAVYQVFSSENWSDILYSAAITEIPLAQTVVVLVFVTAWFLFGNCKLFLVILTSVYHS